MNRTGLQTYKTEGNALALAILAVVLAEFVSIARQPEVRDFISFWGAAQLALDGVPAAAYDKDALRIVQLGAAAFEAGEMPFPYPPAYLLLILPFALLSYPAGMAAWVALTFLGYLAAARRLFPDSGWLAAAFPAVLVNAAVGQNAFVTAGIFIAGMAALPKRPFAAGLLLGCLVLKPQLGLLLPIAFVAGRHWRAFAGAAISSVGTLLAGLLIFGLPATAAWLDQMPLYASIARDGLVGWHKLASIYASARQAGLGQETAFALHLTGALTAAGAVWWAWRSEADSVTKAAVLAAATMLVSPYFFLYDAMILVVPLFWLARAGAPPALIGGLWCLPIVSIAQAHGFSGPVNLNPVVPIALLALICVAIRRASGLELPSLGGDQHSKQHCDRARDSDLPLEPEADCGPGDSDCGGEVALGPVAERPHRGSKLVGRHGDQALVVH